MKNCKKWGKWYNIDDVVELVKKQADRIIKEEIK